MRRKVIQTADGSSTVHIEDMDVTYHSRHGAIQESMHVFINAGLEYFISKSGDTSPVKIFEMGLGTGLNALLTWQYALEKNLPVYYESVEQFPLGAAEVSALSYHTILQDKSALSAIHNADWNIEVALDKIFSFKKSDASLIDYATDVLFDIIYYDAFAPNAQPELWTEEVFTKLYSILNANGLLVTYCSKGDVRRAMIAAGFKVQKIPGPPGKREMLRAVKLT